MDDKPMEVTEVVCSYIQKAMVGLILLPWETTQMLQVSVMAIDRDVNAF